MIIPGRAIGDIVGAKAKGMFFRIQLPSSSDYTGSVGWIEEIPSAFNDVHDISCYYGGKIWCAENGTMHAYDLTTKQLEGPWSCESAVYNAGFMVADNNGVLYWRGSGNGLLKSFDTKTKSSTALVNSEHPYNYSIGCYSKLLNRVYWFGGYDGVYQRETGCFDIGTSSLIAVSLLPYAVTGGIAWENINGDIYIFGSENGSNQWILLKYIPSTNTYTIIKRDIAVFNNGWTDTDSVIMPEGRVLLLNRQNGATKVFNLLTATMEVSPVTNSIAADYTEGRKLTANGKDLYYVTGKKIYKCMLNPATPEDSPIVAKIYEGQKYHTDRPFTISNPHLEIGIQQKTADKDYEIRKNLYSSDGSDCIYIET